MDEQTLRNAVAQIGKLWQAIRDLRASNKAQTNAISWPNPFPDTAYAVLITLHTGTNALGNVFATLKADSKTTTGCVITVRALIAVTTVGVDVVGVRT